MERKNKNTDLHINRTLTLRFHMNLVKIDAMIIAECDRNGVFLKLLIDKQYIQ